MTWLGSKKKVTPSFLKVSTFRAELLWTVSPRHPNYLTFCFLVDCLSPTKLVLGATQTITIASILSDAIFFVPRFLLNIITKDIRVSEKKKNNLFFHYCRSISKSTSYTKKYWKTKLEKIGYITSQLRNGPFNWNEWTLLQMWTDSHWSTASFQGRGCSAEVDPCLITKDHGLKSRPVPTVFFVIGHQLLVTFEVMSILSL